MDVVKGAEFITISLFVGRLSFPLRRLFPCLACSRRGRRREGVCGGGADDGAHGVGGDVRPLLRRPAYASGEVLPLQGEIVLVELDLFAGRKRIARTSAV